MKQLKKYNGKLLPKFNKNYYCILEQTSARIRIDFLSRFRENSCQKPEKTSVEVLKTKKNIERIRIEILTEFEKYLSELGEDSSKKFEKEHTKKYFRRIEFLSKFTENL